MKNCIVAQSGGPTVAINASLAGVINNVMKSNEFDVIYGAVNGITGILDQRVLNLTELFADASMLERLKTTPAMYLGSCRFKLPMASDNRALYEQIFKTFEELEIAAFFYIGGNDSMDTVNKLSNFAKEMDSNVKIIGIPKTIDNDLCVTDHAPGFGSAAKYVATSLREIAHDTYIYRLKSVTIVEVMGRDAGWLTAASALARTEYSKAPHLIYLPETAFDKEQFLADVKALLDTTDNVIVAVSEGIRDENGTYISATTAAADQFGHSQLSGAGKCLEHLVKERLGVKVRSVEINVLQRCAAHISSKTDLDEAFILGEKAVEYAKEGKTGIMVIIERKSDEPYICQYSYANVSGIANEAKEVPREWINEQGNDVTEEMLTYLRPLILGEVSVSYENGLPEYMNVAHLLDR